MLPDFPSLEIGILQAYKIIFYCSSKSYLLSILSLGCSKEAIVNQKAWISRLETASAKLILALLRKRCLTITGIKRGLVRFGTRPLCQLNRRRVLARQQEWSAKECGYPYPATSFLHNRYRAAPSLPTRYRYDPKPAINQ